MAFIDLDKPSDYDILETTPRGSRTNTYAIIKRYYAYDDTSTGYIIVVPDSGDHTNTKALLKMYRRQEQIQRAEKNEKEQEFLDSLKNPHLYMRESRDSLNCYCGKIKDDEIHVEAEDNDF